MNTSTKPPLPLSLNLRLSAMMFLQYAIWGAWLPLLWPYLFGHLDFTAEQIGNLFAVGAIGAIVAPFIAGQIADRWFPTQIFLGISHLLGAAVIWRLPSLSTYQEFLWFSLAYSVIYSPTLALTNSLAFHHIPDRDRDFGRVRVWGTVGWIAAGIAIGQWLAKHYQPTAADFEAAKTAGTTTLATLAEYKSAVLDAGRADAFKLSALLGLALGLFCFVLPHTPPSKEQHSNASLAALNEVRFQPLITLFLLAVPVSCIHQFYFVHTSQFLTRFQSAAADSINQVFGIGGGGLMTIGQMSEIVVLASIPFFAKRTSRKTLLAVGLIAYGLRMAIFAYMDNTVAIMFGIALHGFCFGCFIFVAFMVVDEETTPDVRASAQSLFNLVIVGVGTIVGSIIATTLAAHYTRPDKTIDYTSLFAWPMWASVACLIALLLFYPRRSPRETPITTP